MKTTRSFVCSRLNSFSNTSCDSGTTADGRKVRWLSECSTYAQMVFPNAAGTQPYTGIVRNRIDSLEAASSVSFSDFSPLIFASDSYMGKKVKANLCVPRGLYGHDLHHRLLVGRNAGNENSCGHVHDPRTHGVGSAARIHTFTRIEIDLAFLQVGSDFGRQRII